MSLLENLLSSINRLPSSAEAAPKSSVSSTALISARPLSTAMATLDPHHGSSWQAPALAKVARRGVEMNLLSADRWHATKSAAKAWPAGLLTTHVASPDVIEGEDSPTAVGTLPAVVQAMLIAAGLSPPPSVAQIMRVATAGYFHSSLPCDGSSTVVTRMGDSVKLSQRSGRTAEMLAVKQMGFAREKSPMNATAAGSAEGSAFYKRMTLKRIAPTFVPTLLKHFLGIIAPTKYSVIVFLDDRIEQDDVEAHLTSDSVESAATMLARQRRLARTTAQDPAAHGAHCFAAVSLDAWPVTRPVLARVAPEYPGVLAPSFTFMPSESKLAAANGHQDFEDAYWTGCINAKSRARARTTASGTTGWKRRSGSAPKSDPNSFKSKQQKRRPTEFWATEVVERQYGQQRGHGSCSVRWFKLAPCHGAAAGLWLYDVQPTTGKRLMRAVYGSYSSFSTTGSDSTDAARHAATVNATTHRRKYELSRLQYLLSLGSDGGRKSELIRWERARDFQRMCRERGADGPAYMSFERNCEEALHSLGIDTVIWSSDGEAGKAKAIDAIDSAIDGTRLPALVSDPQGKVALLISGVKVGEGGTSDANTAVLVTSMPSMAHVGAPPGGKGVAHVQTQERTTDWLLGLDRGIPETAPRSMRIVVLCKES